MLGVLYLSEPEAQHQQWTLEHQSESPRDSAMTVETEPADDLYWLQIFRKKNIYINSDSNKSNKWQGLLFSDGFCFTSWSLLCFGKPCTTSKCYVWPTAHKYLFQLFYVMMMMCGVFTPRKMLSKHKLSPCWNTSKAFMWLYSHLKQSCHQAHLREEWKLYYHPWFHLYDNWKTFVVKLCYHPDFIYMTTGEHL